MLVLSNEEINEIIDMKEIIRAMEEVYRDTAEGNTVNLPRSDCYSPSLKGAGNFHLFKTMGAALPRKARSVLRVTSDILSWPGNRRVKMPTADGRWVGLLMLFDNENGKLLAMMPDGVVQATRVGATSALAASYLSRQDACEAAILGSGWQAEKQLEALAAVRKLDKIRVYSPTKENRESFARKMSLSLECDILACPTAEQAARGSDIVLCATNSSGEVFRQEWLAEGMHVSSIRRTEIGQATVDLCDRVFINSLQGKPLSYKPDSVRSEDIPDLAGENKSGIQWSKYQFLAELAAGRVRGREKDTEKTLFMNNIGLGIQFAAVAGILYDLAVSSGLGNVLPDDWFTQDVHS